MRRFQLALVLVLACFATLAWAGTDGSINGTVMDQEGIAVPNITVQLLSSDGKPVAQAVSSPTGDFHIFPVTFGDYQLKAESPGFSYSSVVHVSSGGTTQVEVRLQAAKEMVMNVRAKKHLIQSSASVSSTEINQEEIQQLPEGDEISLPRLLTTTTPGAIQGSFNQMFFRGNHANIQYQLDGVQLPDSPSGTFGEAISPRNIDHMEVITGGIPAEYGERLAAVVNIVSKSGPENPGGELELNYGSYDTYSPHILFGGSNESGSFHYFISANYHQSSRGLDTPQPLNGSDELTGGKDAIHDEADGNNEFAKLDWLLDNKDKLSLILFNAENHFQIPNYPGTFSPNDAIFQSTYADRWGNGGFVYTPPYTNDYQDEANAYTELVWKHTFDNQSFLQIAPYYKFSYVHFQNDPQNDLFSSGNPQAASFYENRDIGNYGLKVDYTMHPNDNHVVKMGTQLQYSQSVGTVSVQTPTSAPSFDTSPDTGVFESVYAQDDWTLSKRWVLNLGLRFDATQFSFSNANPTDSMVQPRVGVNYLVTDTTKLHAFYGELFQPAPVEDLRDTFANTPGAGQIKPYDIKAEKDNYFEVGVAQQFLEKQVAMLNVYYKIAQNMLDDTQLLNTAIAEPYNFSKGYAEGVELSVKGEISAHWSEYFNYSYEIAKGYGISGGVFAFPNSAQPPDEWQYLDHVQIHTANAGATYTLNRFWWTTQALFGSGLRTGPDNGSNLPPHLTFDTTVGYEFKGENWWSRFKISGDVLNIFDDVYPITIANGFNGSHYAAGREFFIRLSKEL